MFSLTTVFITAFSLPGGLPGPRGKRKRDTPVMDAATSAAQSKEVSQESDDESLASGSEESKHVSR